MQSYPAASVTLDSNGSDFVLRSTMVGHDAKLQPYASLARGCLHGEWPGYVWSVTGKKGMIGRKIWEI